MQEFMRGAIIVISQHIGNQLFKSVESRARSQVCIGSSASPKMKEDVKVVWSDMDPGDGGGLTGYDAQAYAARISP